MSRYVSLVSDDGHEFHVSMDVAGHSKVLQSAFAHDSEFSEGQHRKMTLPFRSDLIERALQYLCYKTKYDHEPDDRPAFDISPQQAAELILVADYLQI
jgi:hypothetical protein